MSGGGAFGAGPFGVDTEAEYAAFVGAIRASEYVRQDLVEIGGPPRAIATVAGALVFAERNPLATPTQLDAFIEAYDEALAGFAPADPDLNRAATLTSALRAVWIPSSGPLTGTDTRVGDAAIELLGVDLPALDGFAASQLRLSRFEQAAVRRLANRSETSNVLVRGLYGDAGGDGPREGLASAIDAYLTARGFSPMLGGVDPAQEAVNQGLQALPTFAEFQAITTDQSAAAVLEAEVLADIDAIQLAAFEMIDSITAQETPADLMQSSAELYAAAADPGAPGHGAAVAALEAQQAAILERVQATSDERAAVFAKTLILAQSEFEDVQFAALQAQDFTGLQLETSSTLAVAEQSVGVAGSVVGIAAGLTTGDLWGAVQSTTDLIAGALGLADLLGGGPSKEEQIYDQVVELREQVQELGVQLNSRFDAVDQKLNIIFGTVVSGFEAIGEDIGDLQEDVDALAIDIFKARSQLQRIEAALFGLAEDLLLQELLVEMDKVLDFRNDASADLPYVGSDPNFFVSGQFFFSYATGTALNTTFAGPDAPTLGLFNADEVVGDGVIGRVINELRFVPAGLTTSGGDPVSGPLIGARVPGPAPWAQAAAAYAQLARENPWYFAFLYDGQLAAGDVELDDITAIGQRIPQLAAAARDPELFDALLVNADDAAAGVQAELDAITFNEMAALGLANGAGSVDPWGPLSQAGIYNAAPPLGAVDGPVGPLGVPAEAGLNGWAVTAGGVIDAAYPVSGQTDLVQQLVLGAMVDPGGPLSDVVVQAAIVPDVSCDIGFVKIRIATLAGPFPNYKWVVIREVFGIVEVFGGEEWAPINCSPLWDLNAVLVGAWPQLSVDLGQDDVVFKVYDAGTISFLGFSFPARIGITWDQTLAGTSGFDAPTALPDFVTANLDVLRNGVVRPEIAEAVINPASPLAFAAEQLDNAEALLDGYSTLALGGSLEVSEVLRSGLRAGPGASDVGLRAGDLNALLAAAAANDEGAVGGAPGLDVPDVGAEFAKRIGAVGQEALAGLTLAEGPFPYVEFVLGELEALGANVFRLAIDDAYTASGPLTVSAADGLIANDVVQPGAVAETLGVDLAFFGGADWTPPAHGDVSANPDGSFTYTPDPGFEGDDMFTYRLIAEVDGSLGDPTVVSDPATVVIRVAPPIDDCPGDANADGAVDSQDLNAVLAGFGQTGGAGDVNADGVVNSQDLNLVLAGFGAACP